VRRSTIGLHVTHSYFKIVLHACFHESVQAVLVLLLIPLIFLITLLTMSSAPQRTCMANLSAGACGAGFPMCKLCWPKSDEAFRESIKAEYNVDQLQPFCTAANCWQVVRMSGEARDAEKCHNCYFNGNLAPDARADARADTHADTRADARSRSPRPPWRPDNVADLVAESRAGIQVFRKTATALQAAADRLEEAVKKVESDRLAGSIRVGLDPSRRVDGSVSSTR